MGLYNEDEEQLPFQKDPCGIEADGSSAKSISSRSFRRTLVGLKLSLSSMAVGTFPRFRRTLVGLKLSPRL